jgi:hypothetical protein
VKLPAECHSSIELPLQVYRNTPSQDKHRKSQRTPTNTNNHAPNIVLPPTLLHYPHSDAPPRLPEHSSTRCFPLRGCCACRTWSRLGDWNPIAPEIHEVCFACTHRACEECLDCWVTAEENMRAAARFDNYRDGREKEAKRRKQIAPCVADVIERHCALWEKQGWTEESFVWMSDSRGCAVWLSQPKPPLENPKSIPKNAYHHRRIWFNNHRNRFQGPLLKKHNNQHPCSHPIFWRATSSYPTTATNSDSCHPATPHPTNDLHDDCS